MPVSLSKPALQQFYSRITNDPTRKVDDAALDELVSIVGDRRGVFGLFGAVSSDTIARNLQTQELSAQQKIAIARRGLDRGERSDLLSLVCDPDFMQHLDAAALNFINAIVGLGPLASGVPVVSEVPKATADLSRADTQAVMALRAVMANNQLTAYYDAAIGAVDDVELKKKALALFAALPSIKPTADAVTQAAEFVATGLWTSAPAAIDEMLRSARYLPGRQLLVQTHVAADVPERAAPDYEERRKRVGSYDENGVLAVTHRAALVSDDPKDARAFLVDVDGSADHVSVSKASVFFNNQPHALSPQYVQSSSMRELPYNREAWHIDYDSPLAKAKLCEVAIKMDAHVAKINFAHTPLEHQQAAVKVIFDSIDMLYPHGAPSTQPGRAPDGTRDAARQAIRGTGMCVQQSSVFGALLMPFADMLGVDGQYRSGNCFRNIRGATKNVFAPDWSTGHGWWQLTFRPSMTMTVTDRTWRQVNYTLDRAYGFPYGDRYANTNITGYLPRPVQATDVDVTGAVNVKTVERQFSQVGDGRENHISNGP